MNRVTHKEWLARRPASSRDQPSICCPKGSGPKGLESNPGLNPGFTLGFWTACSNLASTTAFVFLAAAAGAWIISSWRL
jgi:hypothetical protein